MKQAATPERYDRAKLERIRARLVDLQAQSAGLSDRMIGLAEGVRGMTAMCLRAFSRPGQRTFTGSNFAELATLDGTLLAVVGIRREELLRAAADVAEKARIEVRCRELQRAATNHAKLLTRLERWVAQ